MRDDRYMSYDDGQGYMEPEAGQYTQYDQREQYDRGAQYGERGQYEDAPYQGREEYAPRPTRERVSRGAAPANNANPAGKVVEVLGGAARAVVGAFGGVAGRVRSFSASRAQGRVEVEADDYMGVGAACRMCGNPVDRMQGKCPHCGARVRPLYTKITFWIAVVVMVALVVVLSISITSCKTEQAKNPGGTAPVVKVTTAAELQAMVDESETLLAAQTVSHEYTRLSAFKLQQAVTSARTTLTTGGATEQAIADAATALTTAKSGLAEVLAKDAYKWPYAAEYLRNPESSFNQQVALTGTVNNVYLPEDGSLGWSQITLDDGSELAIGVYSSDMSGQLVEGSKVQVYGVLNGDDGGYAFWCDRVEVF